MNGIYFSRRKLIDQLTKIKNIITEFRLRALKKGMNNVMRTVGILMNSSDLERKTGEQIQIEQSE